MAVQMTHASALFIISLCRERRALLPVAWCLRALPSPVRLIGGAMGCARWGLPSSAQRKRLSFSCETPDDGIRAVSEDRRDDRSNEQHRDAATSACIGAAAAWPCAVLHCMAPLGGNPAHAGSRLRPYVCGSRANCRSTMAPR